VCDTDLLFQGWEFPVYIVNKMWSFKTFIFLCVRHLTPGKEGKSGNKACRLW